MKRPLAVLFLVAMAIPNSLAAHDKHKDVTHAVDAFYTALNQLLAGDVSAMKELWSHADDITYLSPAGGIKTGWQTVLADWQAQADLKLNGRVEAKDVHITQNGNLAVVVNYEVGSIKDPDGNMQKIEIRATSTFRKEGGSWKMIGHHADRLVLK